MKGRDHMLANKSIDILLVLDVDLSHMEERARLWRDVRRKYSERAVVRKIQELTRRGYTTYGGDPRGAWLTDKGKAALATSLSPPRLDK